MKETREGIRRSRDQEKMTLNCLIIVLRRGINLTIQRLNCHFSKIKKGDNSAGRVGYLEDYKNCRMK